MGNESGTWVMYGVEWNDPEHIFGYDHVTSAYNESHTESGKRIAMHLVENYPIATGEQIKHILETTVGMPTEKTKKEKKVDYPANLLKELGLEIKTLNEDQVVGLEYEHSDFWHQEVQ